MQFKKGNDRAVVIMPAFGIVIKFPIIRFWRFFHTFVLSLKTPKRALRRLWLNREFFREMLFKGLQANWSEFRFYWATRNVFLQPTYFSLFGFFNIQQIGEPCLMEAEDVWCQLSGFNKSLKRDLWKDSHHFASPENFCFYKGKIRMLDYGSKGSREVVMLHGAYIVEHFDPAYSWEEVKKQFAAQREREAH